MNLASLAVLVFFAAVTHAKFKVLQTNDDGWAEANIRALTDALYADDRFESIMSAPAENQSGTGSSDAPPTVVTDGCEFDTCPAGSPPVGFNASDPRLNYVNSYPVTSVKYGLSTLAPKLLGGDPDLVLSGPNVGNNLGSVVLISGTVGAAVEAAKQGIPAIAFSGNNIKQVSYTVLTTDPDGADAVSGRFNAALALKLSQALLTSPVPGPLLLPAVALNVNFPNISSCASKSTPDSSGPSNSTSTAALGLSWQTPPPHASSSS